MCSAMPNASMRCRRSGAIRLGPVAPTRCTARTRIRRATTTRVARGSLKIRDPGRAIHRHSRFIPDGRLAPVGLVRHTCTSSFRTNPIARMERKAARSRRLDKRRSEKPGRSAIHVCNTTRCDSVYFHSLVPVSDTSDPLKRSPDRLRPRPRSRPIQICKERTMLHAARPRGPIRGHRRESRTAKKRERFETETPAGSATVGPARRHAAPARHTWAARRCIRARSTIGLQSPHSAA
ncbi:hypothetical protein BLA14095_04908 [Burkholderia lata]|nr:hypothetical protein BLA14095_04908 [Burkholderia lata]